MNYRRLGKTGLKVSELSLGSWVTYGGQVGDEAAKVCMVAAYEAGVNFFDGAEVYAKGEAERSMGRVLKQVGWRRESLVLSTKIFWGGEGPNDVGLSHKHVMEGFHAALKRWQVDYLDLAFCHRPDPNTPIEETVRAFDILIKQGKLFYWGTSEWSAAEIITAIKVAREHGLTPPVMEQPQYSLLARSRFEVEYQKVFAEYGYGSTIWSPLASGVLSGKYDAGVPEGSRFAQQSYAWLKDKMVTKAIIDQVKQLEPIAKELGVTRAQLALAWCLKNPNVSTVITGATKPEQVTENMKALAVVEKLTPELMKRLEALFPITA
ncbi:MAG: aldo/keto reductase [Archangium sp.]|nr:aldo/keto reductase [Archangium sp.]MDP3156345.1 aldo/keto reductase [Archangium sp.]MDP3570389.1 aldo/keto reductase [Archangium sp.]